MVDILLVIISNSMPLLYKYSNEYFFHIKFCVPLSLFLQYTYTLGSGIAELKGTYFFRLFGT